MLPGTALTAGKVMDATVAPARMVPVVAPVLVTVPPAVMLPTVAPAETVTLPRVRMSAVLPCAPTLTLPLPPVLPLLTMDFAPIVVPAEPLPSAPKP